MIQSRFKLNALLPLIPAGVVLWIMYELRGVLLPLDKLSFIVYLCLSLFLFILVWVIFGELRTKVIAVAIEGNSIKVGSFFGLGFSKKYYFNQLTGFKVSVLTTKTTSYEYLYLMVNNKKVIKISEFYHSNYSEMKDYITAKVHDLGYENFNLLREVKEIFK
ncbi:MAG: hypothetical protein JJE22_12535 [Bacteroidia bacterium]|nr:hypothetical protein [Bacteroidia bacterium]